MDKLQLAGQNLGWVFNFRSGHLHPAILWCFLVKLPNLRLKTQPKQLLGFLQLDIALPANNTLMLDAIMQSVMAPNELTINKLIFKHFKLES